MTDFNWVDYVILSIFFVSVLAGLMRGLAKEVISLLTWAAAVVVASLFASRVAASFTGSQQVQSAISSASTTMGMNPTQSVSVLAIGTSFVGLFVITLFIGSIINYFISHAVEGQGISFANRLLGALFGLGRGVLINLVTIFLVQLTPLGHEAAWMQSQFVRSFQPAVQWLENIVQPGIDTLKSKMGQTLQNVDSQYLQGASELFQGSNNGNN